MCDIVYNIFEWIKNDFKSNPYRFMVEFFAWFLSIVTSVSMAFTVPNPPFNIIYPVWIVGCVLYSWAAYSRRSFGMLANYLFLTAIDIFGLIKLLTT
jgi:hypothetical protein